MFVSRHFSLLKREGLQLRQQNAPHCDDVAQASCQHEEVEHGMHEASAQAVEHGSRDVAHALGYYPRYRVGRTHAQQRSEGYEHAQSHQAEADSFEIAMLAEASEAHPRSYDGRCPYECEQAPSPIALTA